MNQLFSAQLYGGLWALGEVLIVRCSAVDVDVDVDEAGSGEGRLLERLHRAKERPKMCSEERLYNLGPIRIATELPVAEPPTAEHSVICRSVAYALLSQTWKGTSSRTSPLSRADGSSNQALMR
jgi:hypothetical protein